MNEEKNLERCLASVNGLAEEIIIVDSGSTDGTREVAERHQAQWHHQDWLGFRDQKRVALGLCTKPWVLLVDSDEEISAELRPELIQFFEGDCNTHDGAEFARRTWFMGRWILHGDWYPDRKLRLFRRDRVSIGGAPEHEVAEVPGAVKRMKGDLNHYSFPTMNSYVRKIIVFSDAFLEREIEKNQKWSLARNLSRPAWRFFRGYFVRLGFLDGFPGLWIATATFFLSFVRYSRTFEHENNHPPESSLNE